MLPYGDIQKYIDTAKVHANGGQAAIQMIHVP
jgi:hypothetical protein